MEPLTQQRVDDDINEQGLDAVKKSVSKMNQTIAPLYDSYIRNHESSLALKRQEEREEITLSIARQARDDARLANIIAIIATIIAAIAIILNIINTP